MPKDKKNQKLSLKEYEELREKRKKQRFHFQLYPWPVTTLLVIPFIFFLVLLLTYFFYVKYLPNN